MEFSRVNVCRGSPDPRHLVVMIVALAAKSTLSIQRFGFGFLYSREWDPVKDSSARYLLLRHVVSSAMRF